MICFEIRIAIKYSDSKFATSKCMKGIKLGNSQKNVTFMIISAYMHPMFAAELANSTFTSRPHPDTASTILRSPVDLAIGRSYTMLTLM